MRKILKFNLDGLGPFSFTTYAGCTPLYVGWQDGLKVWMDTKLVRGIQQYNFYVFGTGWEIPEDYTGKYLSTVQGPDGYVYHVFFE